MPQENDEIALEATIQTPNFDRLAGVYRWMERATFGPYLHLCRSAYLRELGLCRRGLVLGDGDGRFTARLLRVNRTIEIDAVDASPVMLAALGRRAGPDAGRIHTHLADAREWLPIAKNSDSSQVRTAEPLYDLVVTHFFLDCLTTAEVEKLATSLLPYLAANAAWVISEFAIPPGRFAAVIGRSLIAMLYWIFGRITGMTVRSLPDHHAALRAAGFTRQRARLWLRGLLSSELWRPNPAASAEPRPLKLD